MALGIEDVAQPGAAALAGGQALVLAMRARAAEPPLVVDLCRLKELGRIHDRGQGLEIGSLVTHSQLSDDPLVQHRLPGLARVAREVADPAVRHRGTIGGALVQNHPGADYTAVLVCLQATVKTSHRTIAAEQALCGRAGGWLQPGELVTSIAIPVPPRFAYAKFRDPASKYALVGVAVAASEGAIRVAVTGAGAHGVFRWAEAEKVLNRTFGPEALNALTDEAFDLVSNPRASALYRTHLIKAMTKQAISSCLAE